MDKEELAGRGAGTYRVVSTGNTDKRIPGERRWGLPDRRLVARAKHSDRRRVERREV